MFWIFLFAKIHLIWISFVSQKLIDSIRDLVAVEIGKARKELSKQQDGIEAEVNKMSQLLRRAVQAGGLHAAKDIVVLPEDPRSRWKRANNVISSAKEFQRRGTQKPSTSIPKKLSLRSAVLSAATTENKSTSK